ncbi:MAG: YgiQ family radical SAM protein [Candidatus Brocadiia bacterium]
MPTTLAEAAKRGWHELDVVIISGDAYVDHPSFGTAVIGRTLEAAGFRVGILPQPDIGRPDDFRALGRPRLFFAIAPGNVDSCLLKYTALKRVRNDDPYTPGGGATKRPKRAAIAYTAAARHAIPGVPVVIGGIECSTRRLIHYDYWDDALRRSILLDSKADILVYGMGERQVVEIARRLDRGDVLDGIPGTVRIMKAKPDTAIELPSFENCRDDKGAFVEHFRILDASGDETLAEPSLGRWVVQNPPWAAMSTGELDAVYELPYARAAHPRHMAAGGVPALSTVETSIVSHRGCFACCSFCALGAHQGREIVFRSIPSILREVEAIKRTPAFHGTISDVGGPSANMFGMTCRKGGCRSRRCLSRKACPFLDTNHDSYIALLEAVAAAPGVRHVFVGSGIRYDLLMTQNDEVLEKIVGRFTGGQLKVAPEHCAESVLKYMEKPEWREYLRFRDRFYRIAARLGLRRHLIPYLITSHPGATLRDEEELLGEMRRLGFVPEQVQDFIPLPMTLSSVMFHTGIDPRTGQSLPVATSREEKERHFAVMRPREEKYRSREGQPPQKSAGRRKRRG